MSDSVISELQRQCAKDPDDVQSRMRLYQELIRCGQASPRSLKLAATHGDAAASGLAGNHPHPPCSGHQDLEELLKLPVNGLDFKGCYWLGDEDLAPLKGSALRRLDLRSCHSLSPRALLKLQDLPLEELRADTLRWSNLNLHHLRRFAFKSLELRLADSRSLPTLLSLNWSALKSLRIRQTQPPISTPLTVLKGKNITDFALDSFQLLEAKHCKTLASLPLKSLKLAKGMAMTDWTLPPLPQLEEFTIAHNDLNDQVLQQLFLSSPQSLTIRHCPNISDAFYSALKGSSVTKLRLECQELSMPAMLQISQLDLEDLAIVACQSCLEDLLRHSPFHSDGATKDFYSPPMPKTGWPTALRELTLLIDQDPEPRLLESLKGLSLDSLQLVCRTPIKPELLSQLSLLPINCLVLEDCRHLEPRDLEGLAPLPLTKLLLGNAPKVQAESLSYIRSLALEWLTLKSLNALSGEALKELSRMPLSQLYLINCPLITDSHLDALKRCPLRSFQHMKCSGIEQHEWQHLRIKGPFFYYDGF